MILYISYTFLRVKLSYAVDDTPHLPLATCKLRAGAPRFHWLPRKAIPVLWASASPDCAPPFAASRNPRS